MKSLVSPRQIVTVMRRLLPEPVLTGMFLPLYDLAVRMLTSSLRRRSFVRAIYLTGSAADGSLCPGVSDLDFVVEVEGEIVRLPQRREIERIFNRARLFFPQIQPTREIGIHSAAEIDNVIVSQRPYLFSIPDQMKLVWSRETIVRRHPYHYTHEIPLLSRLWRKVLLGWQVQGAEYRAHVLQRVTKGLRECGARLGVSLPEWDSSATFAGIVALFQELFAAIERRQWGGEIVVSAERCEQTIVNHLFFESAPLHTFFSGRRPLPPRLRVRVDPEVSAGELETFLSPSDTHSLDYVQFGRLFFPVRYHPDARVIFRGGHPFSSAALMQQPSCNRFVDSDVFRSLSLEVIDPLFTRSQRFAIELLERYPELSVSIHPDDRQRLSVLIDAWRHLLQRDPCSASAYGVGETVGSAHY